MLMPEPPGVQLRRHMFEERDHNAERRTHFSTMGVELGGQLQSSQRAIASVDNEVSLVVLTMYS